MQIVYKKLAEIKPYENNPRHNDHAVEAVANSIREFGFKVPVILDSNNVIVAGHTRVKAAEALGMEEAPCILADDLTDEQVRAFRIADNKTTELSEWDFDLLREELAAVGGNHCHRTTKDNDTDPMEIVLAKLNLEHLYQPELQFVYIRFPTATRRRKSRPNYTVLLTHGNSGGMTIGAGLNRMEPYALAMGWLTYNGYPARKMLRPVPIAPNYAILDGGENKMRVVT